MASVSAESSEKNVHLNDDTDEKDFNKDVIVYTIGNNLSGNGSRIDNDNFNITRKYYDGEILRVDTGNDISNNQISYSFTNTSSLIIDPQLNSVNQSNLFIGQNNSIKKLTTNVITKTIEGSFLINEGGTEINRLIEYNDDIIGTTIDKVNIISNPEWNINKLTLGSSNSVLTIQNGNLIRISFVEDYQFN